MLPDIVLVEQRRPLQGHLAPTWTVACGDQPTGPTILEDVQIRRDREFFSYAFSAYDIG